MGNPVCDDNLSMNITSPDSQTTLLESGNGIVENADCGLYDASYDTTSVGVYDVEIHSITDGVDADFGTTFDVSDSIPFDVIRTAQSKIDPINNPNSFDVTINVDSELVEFATITETVPVVFDVVADGATIETFDDYTEITWTADISNSAVLEYSYSIPLIFPELYELGPLVIDYDLGIFTEARPWYVAADPAPEFTPISREQFQDKYGKNSTKIDGRILNVMTSSNPVSTANAMGLPFVENKMPVYIYLDETDSVSSLSQNITILNTQGTIAAAKLTLDEMNQLAALDSVVRISVPHLAEFYGHAVSEGVSFSLADDFHSDGIIGSGVTIAIIDAGFVPTDPEIVSNVISSTLFDAFNFCGGDKNCGDPAGDSHGTAVAEIIVDMAPGVDLRLYTIATSIDFNDAIQDAINNNVDIITASLGFPFVGGDGVGGNGQFFRAGTSDVARKVDVAQSNGILVTISSGNNAQSHWKGTYTPSTNAIRDSLGFSSFQSVLEFQPGASGNQKACLPVSNAGDNYIMSWNAWDTTNQDYDFVLFNSAMNVILATALVDQTVGGEPIEILPTSVPANNACLVVASWSSTQNHLIHSYDLGNSIDSPVRAGSIGTPADAAGALAVGAIRAANPTEPPATSIDSLEPFSSSGPTDDSRLTPGICAPDGTLSHQSGLNPFLGTSASVPHVAGAAALLLADDPTLTADQLESELINQARFNAAYSVDNLCGADSGALELSLPNNLLSQTTTL